MRLGDILLEARMSRGWNQHDAAGELRVSQPYVSMLENNKNIPSPKTLHRLARTYNLDANLLLKLALEARRVRNRLELVAAVWPLTFLGLGL